LERRPGNAAAATEESAAEWTAGSGSLGPCTAARDSRVDSSGGRTSDSSNFELPPVPCALIQKFEDDDVRIVRACCTIQYDGLRWFSLPACARG
jgi:hypothetical protein